MIKYILLILILTFSVACNNSNYNPDLQYDEIDPVYYNQSFSTKYIVEQYNDANKLYDGDDSNLCGLATAMNLVANLIDGDETVLFSKIKRDFDNYGYNMSIGVKWAGYSDLIKLEMDRNNIIQFIKFCVSNDRAVGLRLSHKTEDRRHAVTIYGYEQQKDRLLLYYTESSDKVYRLKKTSLINGNFTDPVYYIYNIDYGLSLISDLI